MHEAIKKTAWECTLRGVMNAFYQSHWKLRQTFTYCSDRSLLILYSLILGHIIFEVYFPFNTKYTKPTTDMLTGRNLLRLFCRFCHRSRQADGIIDLPCTASFCSRSRQKRIVNSLNSCIGRLGVLISPSNDWGDWSTWRLTSGRTNIMAARPDII